MARDDCLILAALPVPLSGGLVTSVNGELLSGEGEDLGPLLAERETLTSRKDMLLAMLSAGELDRAGFNAAVGRVQAAMAANEREVQRVTSKRLNVRLTASQSVADAWEANDDSWRRAVVGMLIERIVVSPSVRKPFFPLSDGTRARFDVEAVDIVWKI